MKLIPLTQGQFAMVDDEDFEELMRFKWRVAKGSSTTYASRSALVDGVGTQIYMHRKILGVTDRNVLVDHRDHNGLNNQRSNLRVSNYLFNNRNRRSQPGSSSRFVGVCWLKNDKKWRASIQIDGRATSLGRFLSEEEAAIARDAAVRLHYGETAYLNLP